MCTKEKEQQLRSDTNAPFKLKLCILTAALRIQLSFWEYGDRPEVQFSVQYKRLRAPNSTGCYSIQGRKRWRKKVRKEAKEKGEEGKRKGGREGPAI